MLKRMMLKAPRQSCRLFFVFCLSLSTLLFISCGGGGGSSAPPINPASAKDITTFSILSVNGTIVGNAISVTVPNGTNPAALVATFTTTGASVRVGATVQVSGSTSNNFTSPVTYTITAEDASTKNYIVTVTVGAAPTGGIVANHLAAASFDSIPDTYITAAKNNLHIAYGHTSHGSQLITGMDALKNYYGTKYNWSVDETAGVLHLDDYSPAGDLGNPDLITWESRTRSYLNDPANSNINVVIWSWCGQVSGASEANINTYLSLMNQLEQDYPGVKFVYMTGHLDGGGASGNLNQRNNQIRTYCSANDKILFDFADIESYNPSGSGFLALDADDNCGYSGGNWASQWIALNPSDPLAILAQTTNCGECAHSQRLNCVLKGRAVWWLWARIAGWNP